MRVFVFAVATVIVAAGAANAETKKNQPVVLRSVSGTVIQPTRTIIHNPDGSTTIITVPRRSYSKSGHRGAGRLWQPHGLRISNRRRSRAALLVFRARLGWRRRHPTRPTQSDTGIYSRLFEPVLIATDLGAARKRTSPARRRADGRLQCAVESRSSSPTIAAPISEVLTSFAPSDLMSAVRRPLASTAAIAASSASASFAMPNE